MDERTLIKCADCDPMIFSTVSAREIFEFSCEVELDKIRFIGQAAALTARYLTKDCAKITVYTLAEHYANKLVVA